MSQIFKTLFQTGAINVFVLRGALFDTYAQLKSSFSGKKTSVVKSETYLVEKLSKINAAKY